MHIRLTTMQIDMPLTLIKLKKSWKEVQICKLHIIVLQSGLKAPAAVDDLQRSSFNMESCQLQPPKQFCTKAEEQEVSTTHCLSGDFHIKIW